MVFDGFYLLRQISIRTSANGSRFLDMTLADVTGEINAKMWEDVYKRQGRAGVVEQLGDLPQGQAQLAQQQDQLQPRAGLRRIPVSYTHLTRAATPSRSRIKASSKCSVPT